MHYRARITSKGQVTIPLEVRRRLGLSRGDDVDFVLDAGVTILRPFRHEENPFEPYAGVLGTFDDETDINAWVKELRDEEQ